MSRIRGSDVIRILFVKTILTLRLCHFVLFWSTGDNYVKLIHLTFYLGNFTVSRTQIVRNYSTSQSTLMCAFVSPPSPFVSSNMSVQVFCLSYGMVRPNEFRCATDSRSPSPSPLVKCLVKYHQKFPFRTVSFVKS